jgi:SAM-dependent methyltransferase
METREWFKDWFDSKYYHILYKHRDHREAQLFIDALASRLALAQGSRVLDLPCGKGRHSIYLAEKGFNVTGVDLSEQSIAYARQFETDRLSFFVHDMRVPVRVNYFDAVLNLFTSIGYFEKDTDNAKTVSAAAKALKPGGTLVIDFMNVNKVIRGLVKEESKTIDNITFNIRRFVENGFIVKEIRFEDEGKQHVFMERVRALTRVDFEGFLKSAGLKLINLWGDYTLHELDEENSDRLIIAAVKSNI